MTAEREAASLEANTTAQPVERREQGAGGGSDGGALAVRVDAELARLDAEAKRRAKARTALRPLARAQAFDDLKKLEKQLAKVRKALPPEVLAECGLEGLLGELDEWRAGAAGRLRQGLGRALKDACEQAGLTLKVIGKEEPVELRIPPFGVLIHFEKGLAEVLFARQIVKSCPAKVEDILAAHAAARRELEAGFEPQEFFARCLAAYRATLAATGRKGGERVEILEFLPSLALQMQPKKFQVDPVAGNYQGYSRARFAYDVDRLRQAGGLSSDGKRINFGVATGTTASNKKRVVYLEDGEGRGEYKLTVYFTEA